MKSIKRKRCRLYQRNRIWNNKELLLCPLCVKKKKKKTIWCNQYYRATPTSYSVTGLVVSRFPLIFLFFWKCTECKRAMDTILPTHHDYQQSFSQFIAVIALKLWVYNKNASWRGNHYRLRNFSSFFFQDEKTGLL